MRVIAGSARGRALRAPRKAPTRPTADHVKEALFSMLEAEALKRGYESVDDDGRMASGQAWPLVLDLFAGSGALGIEALSRGAQRATFVDQSSDSVQAIRANLSSVGLQELARVEQAPVALALARLTGPFDLVLLDAPYEDQKALTLSCEALGREGLLHQGSAVVVEQASRDQPPDRVGPLPQRRSRVHGGTRITLYACDPELVRCEQG